MCDHNCWMCKICEKYPYSGVDNHEEHFLHAHVKTLNTPSQAFKKHKKSKRHQPLDEKIMKAMAGESSRIDKLLVGDENKCKSKLEINQLYMLFLLSRYS